MCFQPGTPWVSAHLTTLAAALLGSGVSHPLGNPCDILVKFCLHVLKGLGLKLSVESFWYGYCGHNLTPCPSRLAIWAVTALTTSPFAPGDPATRSCSRFSTVGSGWLYFFFCCTSAPTWQVANECLKGWGAGKKLRDRAPTSHVRWAEAKVSLLKCSSSTRTTPAQKWLSPKTRKVCKVRRPSGDKWFYQR